MLVGVQDVHYNVADMERAVAFYRDVLGMRLLDSNPWWSSLEFFGMRVGLRGLGPEPRAALPVLAQDADGAKVGATLTLRSTDLNADLAYLQRRGVTVISQTDQAWGRVALFADSEGNLLKLMQPASERLASVTP